MLEEFNNLVNEHFNKMFLSLVDKKYLRMNEPKLRELGMKCLSIMISSSSVAEHQGCRSDCPNYVGVEESHRVQGEFDDAKSTLHQVNLVLEYKYNVDKIPYDKNMRCFDTSGW